MITRKIETRVANLLKEFAAVGLLGPRQVGKTTLAFDMARRFFPESLYLDLERPSDLAKLQNPENYFMVHPQELIILDEVQRYPELFQILRGIIDERRRAGRKTGQFLLLGSASLDLLKQSAESLAGRIVYQELTGFTVLEVQAQQLQEIHALWVRGGFPESFLANSDQMSFEWRQAFIRTYLERDIPQLGPRIPAELLRRFWTLLAHSQGSMLNASRLATNLEVSVPTIHRYLDLLVDLLLVRVLRPWANNVGKRLVKTPKFYLRDSGITHALLGIASLETLLAHPVVGVSWEGFVIENLLAYLPGQTGVWFYRTASGAEIDLLLEPDTQTRIAIEIKRSLAPTLSKGFYLGCEDVVATHRYLVYPGQERYNIAHDVTVIPIHEMMAELSNFRR